MSSKTLNLLVFNLVWTGCVIGRNELVWLTASFTLIYVFLLIQHTHLTLTQLLLPATTGITIDILLRISGVFVFEHSSLAIPFWLITLWLIFATTLPLSLAVIGRKYWLAMLAGAVGFPFSYGVGESLGAIEFGMDYLPTLALLSFLWALTLPVLFCISTKLSRVTHASS